MDDLISKSEFLTSLIHCKFLGKRAFEEVVEHTNNYPVHVNMDKVKQQIYDKCIEYGYSTRETMELMNILDNGGI